MSSSDNEARGRAWIEVPEPSDGEASRLRELHERVRDPQSGEVDNILAVHGLHPAGLEAHWNLYRAVMAGTRTLRKVERELIALVVSQLNHCHY